MTKYKIIGSNPLNGRIRLSGAKNSGFKLLIASLLGSSASVIENVGLISEVALACENITSLGGNIVARDEHCFVVDPARVEKTEISLENGAKSRSCTYYIPILLHKFGKATVPKPGGDKIGNRPLERHFEGLEAMGAKIEIFETKINLSLKDGQSRLKGVNYKFAKKTHGGTDTLLLAAVMAQGQTVLENVAMEPEVDDLINFLNNMGGDIKRDGENIIINGVETLHGAHFTCMPDRNEAVTFACAAIASRGRVFVECAKAIHLQAFLEKVTAIGAMFNVSDDGIEFWAKGVLKATDVTTGPHPGFMTDWQAVWTGLATQCTGENVIFETVYESRFAHVPLLVKMGAKIDYFQPTVSNPEETYNFNLSDDKPENMHALKVHGPTSLSGSDIDILDIRTGATIILAGLVASGTTVITDSQDQIKRGYENLPEKLVSLGGMIEIINE